jgi:hypothetical protein
VVPLSSLSGAPMAERHANFYVTVFLLHAYESREHTEELESSYRGILVCMACVVHSHHQGIWFTSQSHTCAYIYIYEDHHRRH